MLGSAALAAASTAAAALASSTRARNGFPLCTRCAADWCAPHTAAVAASVWYTWRGAVPGASRPSPAAPCQAELLAKRATSSARAADASNPAGSELGAAVWCAGMLPCAALSRAPGRLGPVRRAPPPPREPREPCSVEDRLLLDPRLVLSTVRQSPLQGSASSVWPATSRNCVARHVLHCAG